MYSSFIYIQKRLKFRFFSTQDILIPVNYWGKFGTQTNFLKQYTYADIFAMSQKERLVRIVFFFPV